ncbi:hypothetical protein PZB75_26525 [Streptomyces sp. AM 4-1-1]|uniref:hypothetical protein n=1 Tax=Streptomyces sp. AM 4-1-1 TaxID=3028710 RepID=UPI0023B998C5|nr:hypothetical protein [Streptomyces sp. AM 4-1-1]WEH36595.1 hypothetical protein PZB75_26525 [Streptomyces sp. AM 4-1-1]
MTSPIRRRPPCIAVVATPFGFGPASKAYSIGQVLAQDHGMDVRYYGADSALDFFRAQRGLRSQHLDPRTLRDDSSVLEAADAVVNVLAPELIASPALAASTYYVDSLGFMWQRADIPEDSPLQQVRAYFAQDLFGSAANLAGLGLPGVTPVSGIVAPTAPPPSAGARPTGRTRALVQLGGLSNPAGHDSAHVYLALAERLLAAVRDDSYDVSVAMNSANGAFSLTAAGPVRHLSRDGFRAALGVCDVVLSSPGMTTLIEVSQANLPYVPLPPQNWSQVLISRHMAARSGHALWPFLIGPYEAIDARAREEEKAAAVREVNRRLTADTGYIAHFAQLARHAVHDPETPDVGAPFEGAWEVADAVAADLDSRSDSYELSMKESER